MNKRLLRLIGIQIVVVGLVLSVFEFLIDNSEIVVGLGGFLPIASLFLKE
jgi:uncharacterized membrane protein